MKDEVESEKKLVAQRSQEIDEVTAQKEELAKTTQAQISQLNAKIQQLESDLKDASQSQGEESEGLQKQLQNLKSTTNEQIA